MTTAIPNPATLQALIDDAANADAFFQGLKVIVDIDPSQLLWILEAAMLRVSEHQGQGITPPQG